MARRKSLDPVLALATACKTGGTVLVQPKHGRKKAKIVAVIANASPSDMANDVLIAHRKKKFSDAELYDRLQSAGLSPEEADEMCNFEMEQE